jgi:alpha-L-fucosidase
MKNFTLLLLLTLTAAGSLAAAESTPKYSPALPTGGSDAGNKNNDQGVEALASGLDNKPERLEWLQDQGFGMFMHWGVDSQLGSTISHSLVGASEDYVKRYREELPKTFNPKRWDAEFYAMLAKTCGMKYIALTTKHHSGFCLWDTKTTPFNVMNTPYGKDIVREFVDACRKYDLAVGLYYSPEDFMYSHDRGYLIDRFNHRPNPDSDPAYVQFIQAQVSELMTNYGPVNVFFIDGQGKKPTKEVVWTLQPDCLITRGAIATPEQTVPGLPPKGAWESCITLGTQWTYKPEQLDKLKDGARTIEILIETRAKGGALLLNIGPRPDGSMNDLHEDILREVGLWMFVNREGVLNTRSWIVTNERDIWFTKKKDEDTIYAILTRQGEWNRKDRREFVIRSAEATDKTEISVLGHNGKIVEYNRDKGADFAPRFEQKPDGLHISVVRGLRYTDDDKWSNPVVVKLTQVKPSCVPPLVVNGKASAKAGEVTFRGDLKHLGDAKAVKVGFEYREYAGFVENMYSGEWQVTDLKDVAQTGPFELKLKLPVGKTYQWRAVVEHPRVKLAGDNATVGVD